MLLLWPWRRTIGRAAAMSACHPQAACGSAFATVQAPLPLVLSGRANVRAIAGVDVHGVHHFPLGLSSPRGVVTTVRRGSRTPRARQFHSRSSAMNPYATLTLATDCMPRAYRRPCGTMREFGRRL